MQRWTGILGILAILGGCWVFSTDRKAIKWRIVAWGVGLQLFFALIVLRFDWGQRAISVAGDAVNQLLSYATAGAAFVASNTATVGGRESGLRCA